jgi:hypothetical protein
VPANQGSIYGLELPVLGCAYCALYSIAQYIWREITNSEIQNGGQCSSLTSNDHICYVSFLRKFDNMTEEIDVQRFRDEFLEFLAELMEQFEELQSLLLTDNLEIADRLLNTAQRCSSGILLFIRVFESRNWDVSVDILALLHRLLEIYDNLVIRYSERLRWIEEREQDNSFHCGQERTGTPGRPRFVVSKPQIEGLQELGFSWSKIARMIGISRITLYRRRLALGIGNEVEFNQLEDHEFDELVASIIQLSPNAGEVMVRGALRARGVKIQRWRIRESLMRVDPVRRRRRQRLRIERRVYRVPGPNSLW